MRRSRITAGPNLRSGESPSTARSAFLKRVLIAAPICFLLCFAGYALLPLPESLNHPTPATLLLLDKTGREITELPSSSARSQRPVGLSEMGDWLPRVAVAVEDRRFYEHHGIDWHSMFASAWRNLASGRIVRGGSTITQQLIKISSGRTRRSWCAKLYEMAGGWKLENQWSKQRILAEYLNRCQYGNRLIGPEAAAQAYFGKSASRLTPAEAVYLAGLSQAPTRYNPLRHAKKARGRYNRSLDLVAAQHLINRDQVTLLGKATPAINWRIPRHEAPHFVEAFLRYHPGLSGIVRTTLDLDLQHLAEEQARSHLRSLHRNDITGTAIVVMENVTGEVRAFVGSPDFRLSEINSALASHSCGSTLKPFVYLRGIDRKILTAATLLPDTPDAIRDAYADYDPQDYNQHYLGPVRVREALACSLNVPAVVALSKVGARPMFYELKRWGFHLRRSLDEYGAGFILGNAEVRPLDLAAAYAGIARGGWAVRPTFLTNTHSIGDRLASREAAEIVTDILCDNEARARSFGLTSPLALNSRVAAKTGTSSGFRDAWTVGFTRERTVAVWVGNPDGRPMHEALAIRAAAPLWARLMNHLLQTDSPVAPLQPSNRMASQDICRLTGLLPSLESPGTVREWFLEGTQPTASASTMFAKNAEGVSCPLLPTEYAAWCQSPFNHLHAIHPASQNIAISQPSDHAVFELEPSLESSQQMLEFACTGGTGQAVRWYVNEREITPRSDGRVFWPLTAGSWQISARTERQNAEVSIRVE